MCYDVMPNYISQLIIHVSNMYVCNASCNSVINPGETVQQWEILSYTRIIHGWPVCDSSVYLHV